MYLAESGIAEWVQGGAAVIVGGAIIVVVKVFVAYIRHRDALEARHAEMEQKASAAKDEAFRSMIANDLAHYHEKCHGALDRVCQALVTVERRLAGMDGE